jgi:hypothetical protein
VQITLAQIKTKVEEFNRAYGDATSRGSETWHTAVLMLAAEYNQSQDVAWLAGFTGFSVAWILERKSRLEENGIWYKGQTIQHWFEENGVVGFWLDVLVAEGRARRTADEFGRKIYKKGDSQ